MNKGFLYRIYPSEEQVSLIRKNIGSARFIYNKLVEWNNSVYESYKHDGVKNNTIPLVSSFKDEFPFLKEVDDYGLANARRNFIKSRTNFFSSLKSKRKGKKIKPPKFKSKNTSKWSYTTSFSHNNVRISNKGIRLPKIGLVKINYHREIEGRILSVTVAEMRDGSFYVSVLTEFEKVVKPYINKENPNVVGLDMSMDKFFVSSNEEDNTTTKYIRLYRKNEKKRKRLNRKMSKKQKVNSDVKVFSKKWNKEVVVKENSKNREKARKKLAKLDKKISNRRKDFCHKQSKLLVKKYDVIVIEDINLQEMSNKLNLGKSVNDLGFGLFKSYLKYKSIEHNCLIIEADRWFPSSKTCSSCGCINKNLKLSEREWVCPGCGQTHDRDFNAALNLRDYYFKIINTSGTEEIQACGDNAYVIDDESITSVVFEVGSSTL